MLLVRNFIHFWLLTRCAFFPNACICTCMHFCIELCDTHHRSLSTKSRGISPFCHDHPLASETGSLLSTDKCADLG